MNNQTTVCRKTASLSSGTSWSYVDLSAVSYLIYSSLELETHTNISLQLNYTLESFLFLLVCFYYGVYSEEFFFFFKHRCQWHLRKDGGEKSGWGRVRGEEGKDKDLLNLIFLLLA